MLSSEMLQHIALFAARGMIAAAVYVYVLRNFRDIVSYAKFNTISPRTAQAVLLLRVALASSLAAGVLVEVASLGLIIIFASSILLHTLRWKSPYSASDGGWEYSLTLLSLSLVTLAFGAGNIVFVN